MVGPITVHKERLRPRHPYVPTARKLLNELSKLTIRATQCINYKLDVKYSSKDQSQLRLFVPTPSARPLGMSLPSRAWVRLNCLRTGVGRFQSSIHK